MLILITGATGFVGSYLTRRAIELGHQVRVFVRRPDDPTLADLALESIRAGDLTDPATMPGAVAGVDAIVHCAAATSSAAYGALTARWINIEGTASLLHAAERSGRPRWIQISTMSAHARSTSIYGRTKFEADERVRASGLPWTILRPSLIFGPAHRGLVEKTLRIMRRLPVMPIVGSGSERLRPVHVGDVTKAVLQCLPSEAAWRKTYMIGSADEITLDGFFDAIARAGGIQKKKVHIPVALALASARLLAALTQNPPITVDNVLGIRELVPVDIEPARRDFGFDPLPFQQALLESFGAAS